MLCSNCAQRFDVNNFFVFSIFSFVRCSPTSAIVKCGTWWKPLSPFQTVLWGTCKITKDFDTMKSCRHLTCLLPSRPAKQRSSGRLHKSRLIDKTKWCPSQQLNGNQFLASNCCIAFQINMLLSFREEDEHRENCPCPEEIQQLLQDFHRLLKQHCGWNTIFYWYMSI